MKKLIPAICMLLVSAVLLGSSTFAWFSMNKTVDATGMSITAQSDATFLVIVEGNTFNPEATTKAVTSTAEEKVLYPVMPKVTLDSTNVSTPASWQYAYSNAPSVEEKTGDYTECTTLDNYVASETFSIGLNAAASAGTTAENLKLTAVTIDTTTSGLEVVVVCGTNVYTTAQNKTGLSVAMADSVGDTAENAALVTVYYYINGESANADVTTDNVANLGGNVSLTFDLV